MTQVAVKGQIWNYWEMGVESHRSTGGHGGPPLLVMHGWGRSGNEWLPMAKELSSTSGRKAYVVDLPAFGGSNIPKVRNIDEYAYLVYELCQYLGIDKVIMIGHSLGGRVGIVLASKYPQLVERLILIDPAGVKPRSIKRVILATLAKLFGWVPSSVRAKLVTSMMDEDFRSAPALQSLYKAVVATDLRKYLRAIKCKVSVIWGERDQILPLSLTKVYRKNLSDRQIRVVWGAGHDPHLSHYSQTKAILTENIV